MNPIKSWKLRHDQGRGFRHGHPWVFSNELAQSPKGVEPGETIELLDESGAFLARGYGNPASLIAFRVLSRDPASREATDEALVHGILKRAWDWRASLGMTQHSFRLCFGEADGLPGVVIDVYRLRGGETVCSVQLNTAGGEKLSPAILAALEKMTGPPLRAILVRDSRSRLLEGLTTEPKAWVNAPEGLDRGPVAIMTEHGEFWTDLARGQKTGFYLDQSANIAVAAEWVQRLAADPSRKSRKFSVLDLFCYVGQWGVSLGAAARGAGASVEVTFADASGPALELALRNAKDRGLDAKSVEADLVEALPATGMHAMVVCDPPALIKKKKDVPTGRKAYLKLNREALKLVEPGGLFVTCSCSGLFPESEFQAMLSQAAHQAKRRVHWIGRGGHAADHPRLAEFPEGQYLKCWIGVVEPHGGA
ncbi:MAG: class I SAM-dependent rRNA methyltransferase [Bacteriovoracia bacterium]